MPSWHDNIERPAVLFANGIGDSIMSLPALRALCEIFQDSLTIACDDWARHALFWDLPAAGFVDLGSRFAQGTRYFDAPSLAQRLRRTDALLSLVPWHSSSLSDLLGQLGLACSVGFHSDFRHSVALNGSIHSAELAFEIPRILNPSLRFDDFAYAPRYPPECCAEADRIRAALPEGARMMVVHGETSFEKRWPAERLARTIDQFLAAHSEYLVFLVGRTELELPGLLHTDQVIPFFGHRLERALALVSRADLFLGVDSSLLHAADFGRVPGVGLFGPTAPEEFGFHIGPHRHVAVSGPMRDISVESVVYALEELVTETHGQSSQ